MSAVPIAAVFRKSLAARYLVITIGALVVAQTLLGAFQILNRSEQLMSSLESRVAAQAGFLSTVSPEAILRSDFLTLETLMRQTSEDPDIVYSLVIGANGRPLTRYFDQTEPLAARAISATGSASNTLTVIEAIRSEPVVREVRVPVVLEQASLGEVWIGYSVENVQNEILSVLLTNIAFTTLISLLLTASTLILFRFQIYRPVHELGKLATALATGDLRQRADIRNLDEIGTLGAAFNNMAEKLQETLDQERVARRQAQEATHAKDLFLATMSHELRTPLNAIVGMIGLMMVSDELSPDNVFMAERTLANAERLLGLINNILDLSRMTVGRLEIIPVEVQTRQLVETIRGDMALRFKEKGLEFVTVVDDALPATIIHDEERLFQIATNLIGNAIKFTDQGQVQMGLMRHGERLVIQVSDTGIGIPTSKQDIIFDEFTQVDASSTRSHGGAGLGLAIVKRLTMLMQGSVRVSSEVGRGSIFTVELPLNLGDRQLVAAAA